MPHAPATPALQDNYSYGSNISPALQQQCGCSSALMRCVHACSAMRLCVSAPPSSSALLEQVYYTVTTRSYCYCSATDLQRSYSSVHACDVSVRAARRQSATDAAALLSSTIIVMCLLLQVVTLAAHLCICMKWCVYIPWLLYSEKLARFSSRFYTACCCLCMMLDDW